MASRAQLVGSVLSGLVIATILYFGGRVLDILIPLVIIVILVLGVLLAWLMFEADRPKQRTSKRDQAMQELLRRAGVPDQKSNVAKTPTIWSILSGLIALLLLGGL